MGIRFAYAPPVWAWVLGGVAIVLLALALYWHARGRLPARRWALLVALRALTLAIVALILLRPIRIEPAPAATGRSVAIVVDDSRSMQLPDSQGIETRLQRARQLVAGRLRPLLADDFDLRVFAATDTLREVPSEDALTGDGRGSDMGGAVSAMAERAAAGEFVGMVLVSDGAVSTPLPASPGTLPVFAIGVGTSGSAVDREVRDVTVSDVSVVDSLADVTADLVSHGPRETVDVRLLENGRPLEVRPVALPGASQPVRERFRVSPSRTTATVYTVEIADAPGELSAVNNRGTVFVPAPGAPHPVLILEGAPGFEHSFLTRTLKHDTGLDVDVIVRKGRNDAGAPTYYVQGASSRTGALVDGFPRTREALFAYDAVVLGNVEADALTRDQLAMLVAFVQQRGGGLAVIGARSFGERGVIGSDLGRVLAVDARGAGAINAAAAASSRQGTRITLTAAGRQHPMMQLAGSRSSETPRRDEPVDPGADASPWSALPSLAAAAAVGPPRAGAEILAMVAGPAGEPQPLVAVQRAGRGRTMVFTGEGAWRWRMGLAANNLAYETFWRQAIRWVAVQAPARVAVDVAPPPLGTTVPVTVRVVTPAFEPVSDASVQVRVEEPGGAGRTLTATLDASEPGLYKTSLLTLSSGVHRLDVEAMRAGVSVGRSSVQTLAGGVDPEFIDPRRNDAVLRRLAESSGGALLGTDDLDGLSARIRAAAASPTARLAERDVWHNGWSFVFICALLGIEWTLRRRWGLR
ncbi:MAG: hypothetical protein IT182_12220 [Acidobacteria bacterium]|nr:hypothetical protein [Acidobacteriota bacterium]